MVMECETISKNVFCLNTVALSMKMKTIKRMR